MTRLVGHSRRFCTLLVAAAVLALAWALGEAAERFEAPPVLDAPLLVGPWALKGPRYEVLDKAPTDGFEALFTVKSDFGTFQALGTDLLVVRIAEIGALDKLDSVSKTEPFVKAAGEARARPLPAAAAVQPLATPYAPTSVARLFEPTPSGVRQIPQMAAGRTKTDANAAATVGRGADVSGWEQERRRLAKELGVDPYTNNPVLAKRLDDVAWVSFVGHPGLNLAGGVSAPFWTGAKLASAIADLIWNTPAADLVVLNGTKLRAMGVDNASIEAFTRNTTFSLSQKAALVTALDNLSGVANRPTAIGLANMAASQDEARFMVWQVLILHQYQHDTGAIAALQALGLTLAARVPGGGLLVAAPVDYVSWTRRLNDFTRRPELLAATDKAFWVFGKLSSRARQELAARGWATKEDVAPGQ